MQWLSDVYHIKAYISVLKDGSQVASWHHSRLRMKSALLKWWVLDFANRQTEHPWTGRPWFGSVKCLCFWPMMCGLSRYNIHLVKWQHFFSVICCDHSFSLKPAVLENWLCGRPVQSNYGTLLPWPPHRWWPLTDSVTSLTLTPMLYLSMFEVVHFRCWNGEI